MVAVIDFTFSSILSQVSIRNHLWIAAHRANSAGIDSICLKLGGRLLRIIISKI